MRGGGLPFRKVVFPLVRVRFRRSKERRSHALKGKRLSDKKPSTTGGGRLF